MLKDYIFSTIFLMKIKQHAQKKEYIIEMLILLGNKSEKIAPITIMSKDIILCLRYSVSDNSILEMSDGEYRKHKTRQ